MITDADRLAAAGAELTIAGHDFHVRYTSRSFKLLEDRYGSIVKLGPLFTAIQEGEAPTYETLFFLLSLGVRHEMVDGEPVDEDWLLDNAPPSRVTEYMDAVSAALTEASPPAPENQSADPTTASQSGSTGRHSSGSRSRNSTVASASSGTG